MIDDFVDKLGNGSRLVSQTGATMNSVAESNHRVTLMMAEIVEATSEQSADIEQIDAAIIHMGETTQQNAALVEEATAASQALHEQTARI